jgi:hypothetical protein
VRYTHIGTCEICGSDIVPDVEWPTDPALVARAMQGPEAKAHRFVAALALLAVALSVALAWGEVTLWGVVPCGLMTVVFVFHPITRWRGREAGEELGEYMKAVPFDGHAMQDGLAREAAVITTSRTPVGCAGMLIGVVLPLALVQWDDPTTVVAGVVAIAGFVLAWVRRHLREVEASAGRGVPL